MVTAAGVAPDWAARDAMISAAEAVAGIQSRLSIKQQRLFQTPIRRGAVACHQSLFHRPWTATVNGRQTASQIQ